jgi:hypothetical protein
MSTLHYNKALGQAFEERSPEVFKADKLHSRQYINEVDKTLSDCFEDYSYEPVWANGKRFDLHFRTES